MQKWTFALSSSDLKSLDFKVKVSRLFMKLFKTLNIDMPQYDEIYSRSSIYIKTCAQHKSKLVCSMVSSMAAIIRFKDFMLWFVHKDVKLLLLILLLIA